MPIDKVPADQPNVEHQVVAKYLAPMAGPASILLRRTSAKDAWQRVKPGTAISTGDTLVSLPGYRTDLQLNAGARLVLWGNVPEFANLPVLGSTAILNVPERPFDVDLTLDHGRIVLANTKAEGAVRVKVRFHDEVWDLTLKDGEAVVALELWGGYLPGSSFQKKPGGEPPGAVMDLLGLGGETDVENTLRQVYSRQPDVFPLEQYRCPLARRNRFRRACPNGTPSPCRTRRRPRK